MRKPSILKDLKKAMMAINNYQSPIEKSRLEFSSYRVKWLEDFCTTTPFSYDDLYSVCRCLIDDWKISPELRILKLLCEYSASRCVNPYYLISSIKRSLEAL